MARGSRDAMTLAIHLLRGWPGGPAVLGDLGAPQKVVLLGQAQLAHVLAYKVVSVSLEDLPLIRRNPAEIESANMVLMGGRLGLTMSVINALDEEQAREAICGMADVTAALARAAWGPAAEVQLWEMRRQMTPETLAPVRAALKHERQQRHAGLS